MTKKEAYKIAGYALATTIDSLKQGEWLFEYKEQDQEKIIQALDKIYYKLT